MERLEALYSDLTGVNIDEQKRLWDDRGKGYYGEFLVFGELYKKIPGICKILMNLQLPTSLGPTTEIDLLMIHETGLYVFEVKHFKGTIYGHINDKSWTQYFRTSSNHSFKNPVKQNQYHIENVKRLYPNLPVWSVVVFTSCECDLKIHGHLANVSICTFNNLIFELLSIFKCRRQVLNMEQISSIFEDLRAYSPISMEKVCFEDKPIPFYDFVANFISNFKADLLAQEHSFKKKANKAKWMALSTSFLAILISIILSFGAIKLHDLLAAKEVEEYKQAALLAQQESSQAKADLDSFAQKFEYVGVFNSEDIEIKEDMVLVSDVVLKESSDFKDVVNFSCLLTWNGDNYSVSIGEDARIIVFLKNGSIQEYDLWNDNYPYLYTYGLGCSKFYLNYKIGIHELKDVNLSEISYIKLVNLGLRSNLNYSRDDLFSGYEIELYRSDN